MIYRILKMTVNIKFASVDQTPLFRALAKVKATKQGKGDH